MQVGFKVDADVYQALVSYAEEQSCSVSAAGRLLLRSALLENGAQLGALDLDGHHRDEIRREVVQDTRRIIAKALNGHWKKG